MASNFAGRTCKRALQQHAPTFAQASRTPLLRRSLAVSTARAAPPSNQSAEGPVAPENSHALSNRKAQREAPTTRASKDPSPLAGRTRIARQLLQHAGDSTETYAAYGVTGMLIKECARQADYHVEKNKDGEAPKTDKGEDLGVGEGWWYTGLGLTPTFNTWAQITFLHMYALTVRIRQFPADHAPVWHQHLLDHFFYAAEDRMVVHHNMVARGIRNRYLKDLFIQWRGVMTAYDEGLVKGDATLAAAVWRNVWKAEEVNSKGLATVVSYLRREVQKLQELSDAKIAAAEVMFDGPWREEKDVKARSSMLTKRFTPEEEKEEEGR